MLCKPPPVLETTTTRLCRCMLELITRGATIVVIKSWNRPPGKLQPARAVVEAVMPSPSMLQTVCTKAGTGNVICFNGERLPDADCWNRQQKNVVTMLRGSCNWQKQWRRRCFNLERRKNCYRETPWPSSRKKSRFQQFHVNKLKLFICRVEAFV